MPTVAPPASPPRPPSPPRLAPLENGDAHQKHNGPDPDSTTPALAPPSPPKPPSPPPERRKTRSGSAETIDDIAAMIASTDRGPVEPPEPADADPPVTVDKLKSVLASPDPKSQPDHEPEKVDRSPPKVEEKEKPPEPLVEAAAAPKRRTTRTSNSESTNVPVESPSEAKPAEPEASEGRSAEPTAASFVEVENQLEKMFAGLEEEPRKENGGTEKVAKAKKRRKSAPTKVSDQIILQYAVSHC